MPLQAELQEFTTSSPAVASYSYTDIADGTGVVELYGCQSKETTTPAYFLTTNVMHPNDVYSQNETPVNPNAGELTKVSDLDFNQSPFNSSRVVKGTFRAQVTYAQGASTSSNQSGTSYVVVKLRKYSGSTETDLATATSETMTVPSLSLLFNTVNLSAAITETVFAIGDILRITVETWATGQGAGGAGSYATRTYLYHDPINTAATSDEDTARTTRLLFFVPFKIDL